MRGQLGGHYISSLNIKTSCACYDTNLLYKYATMDSFVFNTTRKKSNQILIYVFTSQDITARA